MSEQVGEPVCAPKTRRRRSLTDQQVYALTVFILAQNKLIDAKTAWCHE